MTQMANVVTNDTDNAHTFKPFSSSNGVATWIESNGVPVADRKLTVSTSRTTGGRIKSIIKLAVPVVQDVVLNGVSKPTVVRNSYAEATFSFDPTSSQLERWDHIAMFTGSIVHAGVFEALRDGEPVF